MLTSLLALALVAAACGSDDAAERRPETETARSAVVRLLAIGDSVLEWNGDDSTPVQTGGTLEARGISTVVEELYADAVHPSPEGSEVIGALVADLIAATV